VTDGTRCYFSRDIPFGVSGGYLDLSELLDETPMQVVETTPVPQIARAFAVIYPRAVIDLTLASDMFKQLGLRYCLVVRHSRLVGFISKKDILRHRRRVDQVRVRFFVPDVHPSALQRIARAHHLPLDGDDDDL